MGETKLAKIAWETKLQRNNDREKPRTFWNIEIARILGEKGIIWIQSKEIASDRKEWRNVSSSKVEDALI